MTNIIFQPKTLDWTLIKDICNSNNHNDDMPSEEYRKLIELTYKDNWVKYFPDPIGTLIHEFSHQDCEKLMEARQVSVMTQRRSNLHKEDLIEIENKLPELKDKYFIRFSECSPKDGKFGCGPLKSKTEIIDSIITSQRIHKLLRRAIENKEILKLYIAPWNYVWNRDLEFRVFNYEGNITCISQYSWHVDIGLTRDKMKIITKNILKFFGEHKNNILQVANSCILDVIALETKDDYKIEFIEMNSFGKELASGSALFHWIDDFDLIYNKDSGVYVRYVCDDEI